MSNIRRQADDPATRAGNEAPALPRPTILTGWGMYPRVQGIEITRDFFGATEWATLSRGCA